MVKFGSREIAATAIMASLATVATMMFTFPIPATNGFFNLGDVIVVVSGLTFGPLIGGISGGVGSALADILLGYGTYAPFTLIIKGCEGLIVGYLAGGKDDQKISRVIIAWIAGGIILVGGYFIVQVFMYGFAGALVELPANLVQMLVSGLGIPIYLGIRKRLRL
jgi:uncharacterized membrane protein